MPASEKVLKRAHAIHCKRLKHYKFCAHSRQRLGTKILSGIGFWGPREPNSKECILIFHFDPLLSLVYSAPYPMHISMHPTSWPPVAYELSAAKAVHCLLDPQNIVWGVLVGAWEFEELKHPPAPPIQAPAPTCSSHPSSSSLLLLPS